MSSRWGQLAAMVAMLGLVTMDLKAQAPAQQPQPQQDPLLSLLMSQPKVDLEAPIAVSATFDPPVVKPGEVAIYRVTFNALEESVEWPDKLAPVAGLTLRSSARGQILQMAGPKMEPRSSFNHHATAAAGTFLVPEFTVRVYGKPVKVPPATLQVSPDLASGAVGAPELRVEMASTNLFAGQSVAVRVVMPTAVGNAQVLSQVQLVGPGVLVDQSSARQSIEPIGAPGNRIAYVYEALLTPIASGEIEFHAQGWCAPGRTTPTVVNGVLVSGTLDYVLMDSELMRIKVVPLPREGRPKGFTGAVGKFTRQSLVLSTNVVTAGQPLKLTVTWRGEGNLARLVPPAPPAVQDWQVLPARLDRTTPQVVHARGNVSCTYTLVPLDAGASRTPEIPFGYFDPAKKVYVDDPIPGLPVTVLPGKSAEAMLTRRAARALIPEKDAEPVLSGLNATPGRIASSLRPVQQRPWFPVVQLAPAALVLGLWGWDRRRRYLEAHPDIVFRRKARRALKKEQRRIRDAIARHDAAGFAHSGVRALQVACSPYYPAEARALVGGDIIDVLKKWDCLNGAEEAVRTFFRSQDAEQFSRNAPDLAPLLELRPQLESVLERLDERLGR